MNKKYEIVGIENLTFEQREEADNYCNDVLNLKNYTIRDTKTKQVWGYKITKNGYKYCLTSTDNNSAKYGNCGVCQKHSGETYYQTESKYFIEDDGGTGYTQYQCNNLFGCKECLINSRR